MKATIKFAVKFSAAFIATLTAFQAFGSDEFDFTPCEPVEAIALLAKDNMPYWAKGEAPSKAACYQVLKAFAAVATSDDVTVLEEAYEGRVRIFADDLSFAQFIQEQQGANSFQVDAMKPQSLLPVFQPNVPVFFAR